MPPRRYPPVPDFVGFGWDYRNDDWHDEWWRRWRNAWRAIDHEYLQHLMDILLHVYETNSQQVAFKKMKQDSRYRVWFHSYYGVWPLFTMWYAHWNRDSQRLVEHLRQARRPP